MSSLSGAEAGSAIDEKFSCREKNARRKIRVWRGGKAIAEGMCPSFLSYRGFFSLLPSVKSMKGGGEEDRKSLVF